MAEARRRAREQFGVELEHEVEFLGAARAPDLRRCRSRACGGEVAPGRRATPQDAARAAPRPAARPPAPAPAARDRLDLRRLVPSAARSLASDRRARRRALSRARARDVAVRRSHDRGRRAPPRRRSARSSGLCAPRRGESLFALDARRGRAGGVAALPRSPSRPFDRAFPHTLRVIVVPERPVAVAPAGRGLVPRLRGAAG